MTQDEREMLLSELMRGIPKSAPVYRELECFESADVDRLEPIIERIIRSRLLEFARFLFGTVFMPEQLIEIHERVLRLGWSKSEQFSAGKDVL
ncbi:MAG TPA: hypothetical protein VKV15_25895 [Bryobacteraceae bacterium]|jgi:hypothetical protein|nr:hypothetical protein [Bryobacteraceae bacterium]